MRRAFPPPSPQEGLARFEALQRDGSGLRFLMAFLPQGASLEEARALYHRLRQESRTPSRLLDEPLGIRRD